MIYSSSYILREHLAILTFSQTTTYVLRCWRWYFHCTSHLRFEFLLKYALYINLAIVGLDFYDHTGFGISVKGASRWVASRREDSAW